MAVAPEADRQVDLTGRRSGARGPFDESPRGRVLAAMVEVVDHGGYRDATVDRVLERAHVGWSEFIRLFDDLDACFLATMQAGLELAATRAEDAAAAAGDDADIETVFEAALRAVLEAAAARPDLARLCLVEAPALGAAFLQRRQIGLQRFVELLERHLDRSRPRDRGGPPALAAEMVVGGIYEGVQHRARAGEVQQLPSLVDELGRLWLPALRGA